MKEYYNRLNQVIYNCDNLELLKDLRSGLVDLIYCDILYNTGKKFEDYNDNLGSPREAIEWYRPRIIEMKRVLKPNGSIFLHCNWRLDSYIRILMDEIFGENCFRNSIYRKHSNERGFYRNFDSVIDIIHYYVRDKDNFTFNESKSNIKKLYPLFDDGYVEGKSKSVLLGDSLIDFKALNMNPLVDENTMIDLYNNNQIEIVNGLPYRISYNEQYSNLWTSQDMLDNFKNDDYGTPKPEPILDRIINICSNEGDTVADFFLGSGTTAVAAKKLKRKGIYCDISRKACDTTIKKLEELN